MNSHKADQQSDLPDLPNEYKNDERAELVASLRCKLTEHLGRLNLGVHRDGNGTKGQIRLSHSAHRLESLARDRKALAKRGRILIDRLAIGTDVEPERIDPEIVQVRPNSSDSLLFRLATTLWSVPVSTGYGRRMRFLIIDRNNDKLIGVLAIGDPVFNLSARDNWIGWNVEHRYEGLVNVMDAYVVGAVPPYSQLLGGKLVTALVGSSEVAIGFKKRYSQSTGLLSGRKKKPRLALVTVTSALGRSSIYNRVKLPGLIDLQHIGATKGWGHFHIPEHIFSDMRLLLSLDGHKYADGHQFGSGPNWRLRVIRKALSLIGLDERLLRHGIGREVYAMPLARNWRAFLRGEARIYGSQRPSADAISKACLERWVLPRSIRRPGYRDWSSEDRARLLEPVFGDGVGVVG